jgi:YidC/Oxa1 family membrane protein insertase
MDKNTLIGLLLIGAIMVGFSIWNAPSDEEIALQREIRDSIAQVDAQRAAENSASEAKASAADERKVAIKETVDTLSIDSNQRMNDDEAVKRANELYGAFSGAANQEAQDIEVETDLMKLTFSTKGGRLKKAVLKDYETYNGGPLVLFDSTSAFNLNFFSSDNKNIFTDELVFDTDVQSTKIYGSDEKVISFKLKADKERYIEYVYRIRGDQYLIDFDVNMIGMNELIDMRSGEVYLNWMVNTPNQEKSMKSQRDASSVHFKYNEDDIDDLGMSEEEREDFEASVKWVSFKQQFFNTTLIATESFDKSRAFAAMETDEGSSDYVKKMSTALTIPVRGAEVENFNMQMYLGPNKYNILKKYDIGLENIISLGWGIFGWVNKYAVIPVFNFLDGFHWNYGIIILVLTILLKLVLSPITYKTYMSGAKMRVLKPEIKEINDKYKDDAMKKQQAMMTLYRQTGVNPLSGCIPLLIQMPILIAMFRFFPASIELRQESFLWAEDLSTYDSIYNFPDGFTIPFYGDHISLFTLLMAVSIMLYTKLNSQMSMGAASEGPMAAQMKIMMYIMPVMMLFFFNNYSSGLSYYYFLANIISIGQTFLIRKVFINEDAIRAKIEVNKKRPKAKKKSGFQKRMEEMAKQRGVQPPKK